MEGSHQTHSDNSLASQIQGNVEFGEGRKALQNVGDYVWEISREH
jgi:hypothetical protein